MTKDEYEKLLKSDYWKGYSYSLIKERNFTCEDCGRTFYNERNKLQVHHLVYRDTNPWSYKPEELIVLCEECHKRRHGIITEEMPVTENVSHINRNHCDREWVESPMRKINYKYVLYFVLLLFIILIGASYSSKSDNSNHEEKYQELDPNLLNEDAKQGVIQTSNNVKSKHTSVKNNNGDIIDDVSLNEPQKPVEISEEVNDINTSSLDNTDNKKSITDIINNNTYKQVIKQAQRAGVSTEGTTSEILDRITHANVVKQAQRAGVSTEGTTSEILDRITKKSMEDILNE